jgi:hypothetical protein
MTTPIPFTGLRGRVLAGLLQLPSVRFHRIQRGVAETPSEYERFVVEVVGPRLTRLSGRLGIFGAGEHTRMVLQALPAILDRVHCLLDNNTALWHQERHGRLVLPPAQAVCDCDTIFLSTAVFQHVLRADLKRLDFKGTIIAMDDIVPPQWFLAA